jgi:hypothetical protein
MNASKTEMMMPVSTHSRKQMKKLHVLARAKPHRLLEKYTWHCKYVLGHCAGRSRDGMNERRLRLMKIDEAITMKARRFC